MRVWVYYTPEAIPAGNPDCAVVVDVLRATSMITTCLATGASEVHVHAEIEDLELAARAYGDPKILVGERGGFKLPGFDMGNSPLECDPEIMRGKRVYMTTTNGTRTMERLKSAPLLLAGALINAQSVVDFICARNFESVWIACSGWEGAYSLEDSFCAGLIASHFEAANDEAVAAVSLYRHWQDRQLDLLKIATHGKRLIQRGYSEDLVYCAEVNRIQVLPQQCRPGVFKKA